MKFFKHFYLYVDSTRSFLYFVINFYLCVNVICVLLFMHVVPCIVLVKQLIKKLLMKFDITNHNNTLHMYADSTSNTYVSCTFNTVLSKVTKRSIT